MKKILIWCIFLTNFVNGQGYNHQWLLGSYNFLQDPKGRILFDANSYSLINENRKMVFKGTQGNISDVNGNILMSSNGVWIANATGDTMMNGNGLNPGGITSSWPYGLPMTYNNIIFPFPGDTSKYVLFHHTGTFNGLYYPAYEIFYSIIDLSLDGGLGAVITKNNIALQDTLAWGIGACKHANGRDWWIVVLKDNSDLLFKFLFTPSGLQSMSSQVLGIAPTVGASVQLTFSPDGTKFVCSKSDGGTVIDHFVRILDFDRCTGVFSNPQVFDISTGGIGAGLSFSPSGKYVYACSFNFIYQIDTEFLIVDTVATYDGFISPGPSCCATSFWNMYLAANGKIYITSGSGVQHLHEINFPDSAGISCDVQQHAINLGYAQLRSVPNHPNYYLGCDTTLGCPCLTTGFNELNIHDFKFSVSPNPSNGNFKISYLLPQNEKGKLDVFDVNGRKVYEMNLPQWSTMQNISLPEVDPGLYNCTITSGHERANKRIVVIK